MDQNELPRTYKLGTSRRGRPTIIINRKPSQIPGHLDLALIRLAGTAELDGPNSVVTYEFLLPEKLPAAEKYLKGSMWEKEVTSGGGND